MPTARPPHIHHVLIAAADLEDAAFQRDRLALACGEAIRDALEGGFSHLQIARAADMTEAEVRRHAEAPPVGPDVLGDVAALAPCSAGVTEPQEDGTSSGPSHSALREDDAVL
ncbi:hypothetical protein [Arthrobacter sp. B0490]|uniref:hypothetical protein n=1 Tax=Arthrobacter sp. B0490 TaxID=2058891 RepID=UPI000CE56A20|nr:hypothetical protein [Arthrobacter sp. B0490]